MRSKKRWSDYTPRQRKVIVAAGVVEAAFTTVALLDMARRPSPQVRGPKPLWVLGCFVQPIGPLAYLLFARRDRLQP